MKYSNKTIYKSLLFGALLSVTLIAGTGSAQASLVSYSGGLTGNSNDPYPNPLLPPLSFDGNISLNQFNSNLGTLNSATINLSSVFNYGTRFENKSPSSGSTVTKNLDHRLIISTLGQTMLDTGLVHYNLVRTVGLYDGSLDYAGTSGFTVSASNGATTNQLTLSGAALASYIGTGSLMLDVFSNASFTGSFTGGNGTFPNSQSFVTNTTVTYDYTPTPIPAAGWLLGSGLLGLAGLRRKQK
jgi:hypothetical protein